MLGKAAAVGGCFYHNGRFWSAVLLVSGLCHMNARTQRFPLEL